MKRIASSLIALMAMSTMSASDSFTITGKFPGLKAGTKIELVNKDIRDKDTWLTLDTVAFDGGFIMNGNIDMPTYCELRLILDESAYKVNTVYIMAEKGLTEVSAAHVDSVPPIFYFGSKDLYRKSNVAVKGGQAQKELEEYDKYLLPYEAAMKNAHSELYIDTKPGRTEEEEKALSDKYDRTVAGFKAARERFINEHPAYHISAMHWVENLSRPFVYSSEQLDSILSRVIKNNSPARVAMVNKTVDKARGFLRAQPYHDFDAFDADGNPQKFAGLAENGKYTLVDFWASWCGPCRMAIPRVREIYNKYGEKIDILSVSLDKSIDDWERALDKEKMEWTQWRVQPEDSDVSVNYNFSSIPFMLLIDNEGKILFAGHDTDIISKILSEKI